MQVIIWHIMHMCHVLHMHEHTHLQKLMVKSNDGLYESILFFFSSVFAVQLTKIEVYKYAKL